MYAHFIQFSGAPKCQKSWWERTYVVGLMGPPPSLIRMIVPKIGGVLSPYPYTFLRSWFDTQGVCILSSFNFFLFTMKKYENNQLSITFDRQG